MTDLAATAESLQPTGYTLETTKVSVPRFGIRMVVKQELFDLSKDEKEIKLA
jgi:hypothetical protein